MSDVAEDPREQRLPLWAKTKLAALRRRLREAEKAAERASLSTDPDGSLALLSRLDDPPVGLGEDPQVAFRVPFVGYPRESSFIEVSANVTRTGLRVHAPEEIVWRQRSINSAEILPWPKRW